MGENIQSTSPDFIENTSTAHLLMLVKPELVPIFFQLLGYGFKVNVQAGCSIKDLLCRQLGIHENYLEERIQTIFLNAKVVDDVNSAVVSDGSILALSGAMPGLVGAILRSGGFYASMRSRISYDKNKSSLQQGTGKITLKLLNLVAKDLGLSFLQQGICLKVEKLCDFLWSYAKELKAGCKTSELDGNLVKIDHLQETNWNTDLVVLQVEAEGRGQMTERQMVDER